MKTPALLFCTAATLVLFSPGLAMAEDVAAAPEITVTATGLLNSEILPTGAADETVLADDDLGNQRGGQGITIANQSLSAVTSGGTINGAFTAGAVNLTDNALSNFAGIGNVVINTGAQNNLQSGINLVINVIN